VFSFIIFRSLFRLIFVVIPLYVKGNIPLL